MIEPHPRWTEPIFWQHMEDLAASFEDKGKPWRRAFRGRRNRGSWPR